MYPYNDEERLMEAASHLIKVLFLSDRFLNDAHYGDDLELARENLARRARDLVESVDRLLPKEQPLRWDRRDSYHVDTLEKE